MRRAGIQQPSAGLMRGRYLEIRWPVLEVYLQRLRITRGKRIAADRMEQVRRGTLYGIQILALNAKLRQGAEQRPSIRMLGIIEHLVRGAYFNYVARVHNGNAIRNVCNNAKVMRYVNGSQLIFVLKLLYQILNLIKQLRTNMS